MKVLVCGGRNYNDVSTAYDILDEVHRKHKITYVIHGDATGADSIAGCWALARGIQEVACPANWEKFGRRAGAIRNRNMIGLSPSLVIAFPGGRGTAMMCDMAVEAGIPVEIVGQY